MARIAANRVVNISLPDTNNLDSSRLDGQAKHWKWQCPRAWNFHRPENLHSGMAKKYLAKGLTNSKIPVYLQMAQG